MNNIISIAINYSKSGYAVYGKFTSHRPDMLITRKISKTYKTRQNCERYGLVDLAIW